MDQGQKFQIKKTTIYWLLLICIIIFRSLANTLEFGDKINIIASQSINMLVLLYGVYSLANMIKTKHKVFKKDAFTVLVFCWYMVSLCLSDYFASGEWIQLNIYMMIFVIGVALNNTLDCYEYTKYLNWISGLFVYLSLVTAVGKLLHNVMGEERTSPRAASVKVLGETSNQISTKLIS